MLSILGLEARDRGLETGDHDRPLEEDIEVGLGGGYEGFLAMEYQRGRQSTERLPDPDVRLLEGLVFLKST